MKPKLFWTALIVIVVSWTINSIYAKSMQLAEPIFLDHYIERNIDDSKYFTFYYLVNKNDLSYINYVAIDDVNGYVENNGFYNNTPNADIQYFTHQTLRKITISLNEFELENKLRNQSFSFNKMDVFFSNGKKVTASIGDVVIHPSINSHSSSSDSPLQFVQSGGSNDEHYTSTYKATEPVTIDYLTYSFEDILGDDISVKLQKSSSSELPIHLQKDDTIQLITNFSLGRTNYIEPYMTLTGTLSTGETFTFQNALLIQPFIQQVDVKKIMRKKRGRDSD